MNREIKFRVWDKTNKKMMGVTFLDFVELEVLCGCDPQAPVIRGFEYLMQYTGLKDKNGKEIYEGDIVRFDYSKMNYEILFQDGLFGYKEPSCEPSKFYFYCLSGWIKPLNEVEVIGNIYENPELLEKID